jgi:ABC-2 type transport system ATP-binding protein
MAFLFCTRRSGRREGEQTMQALAIETERLGRTYKPRRHERHESGSRAALSDVSLAVRRGELFGLLGPNGAGKTTLIKILTTLLAPSSGWAAVEGYDVHREPQFVRPCINMVSGGEASGYGLLTVRENLWMFAQFYGLSSADANRRIIELLEVVKMSDRMHTKSSQLSTGLRQKMNIARGFLTDPRVLFLDEPTLGLDVEASRDARHYIRRWVAEQPSRTVLLTTHYMVEADELCDRVAIINGGRVLACDTPANLKRRLQCDSIFHLEAAPLALEDVTAISALPGVRKATLHHGGSHSSIELVLQEERILGPVIGLLESRRIGIVNLTKREPTLEDVFIALVGRSMEEVEHVQDS